MKVVLQRVAKAGVSVNGGVPRTVGPGLLLLVGVAVEDTEQIADKMAEKCAELRIFEDEQGKLNRSAAELGLSALVVSNFTLQADTRKGRRPSFIGAAKPPLSIQLYERFVETLRAQPLKEVKTGEFGADMQVELVNDGPITLVLDSQDWLRPRHGGETAASVQDAPKGGTQ